MGAIKVDEKGRIRCYPFGRKKIAKKAAHKAARHISNKIVERSERVA